MKDLESLKTSQFSQARKFSIGVSDRLELVPIGHWIFQKPAFIEKMALWRNQSGDNFFATFPLSVESYEKYLKEHSIMDKSTILFAIIENKDCLAGHLGLSNISADSATVDAVMIGPDFRRQGLAMKSMESLLEWGSETFGISRCELEVVSNNISAIALYENLGFIIQARYALKENMTGLMRELVPCDESEATTDRMKIKMVMEYRPSRHETSR